MSNIVGVRFKTKAKTYNFESNIDLNLDNVVVVETERGLQLGTVVSAAKIKNSGDKMMPVLRLATEKDINEYSKNESDEVLALEKAVTIADRLSLNMKFISASFTLDRSQLLFYFVSDERVDFRDLAKELASIYKTRIELRQVGVRDKAKEVSGVGPCGRKLCCASFLNNMDSVSISMAKNQNLSLNPNKINGLCGRLLCCLTYEDDLYKTSRKGMPNVGAEVETEFGKGTVVGVNIPTRTYSVYVENHGKVEITLPSHNGCGKCGKGNK